MTCRTLFALISAAMVWNLPNITLAQAMQGDSNSTLDPATDAKEVESETNAVLQMPAKKAPPKKKPAAPARNTQGKPALKPAPRYIPKPGKPAPKPAAPRQAPFFPPAPPVQLDPVDNSRFQVPLPEDKGDLNIWGDDPAAPPVGSSTEARHQLGLIGIGSYLGAGFGLEYLRRSTSWMDWGLQLMSTGAKLTNTKNPETDEFLSIRMSSVRFGLRVFNRRWLHAGAGLSVNAIQGQYGWEGPGVADEKIATDFQARLALLDFVLGSQWEPGKGFYIAVDWLGFGVPLIGTIDYSVDPDLDDLTELLSGSKVNERIRKELGAQFRPYYGLLKFGYMF